MTAPAASTSRPGWLSGNSDLPLTDVQKDRRDRLEARFPGSRFDLLDSELSGARYEVETEFGFTEILISRNGRVLELL